MYIHLHVFNNNNSTICTETNNCFLWKIFFNSLTINIIFNILNLPTKNKIPNFIILVQLIINVHRYDILNIIDTSGPA